MMNEKYIKKLERVLGEHGINVIGYQLENYIVSEFMNNDGVEDYIARPYRDFDFEEYPVKAKSDFKDGFYIEIEGSLKNSMDLNDKRYVQINIYEVYVVDSQGIRSPLDFSYTYGC